MDYKFTEEEWLSCLKVLEVLKNDPLHNPDNKRFKTLATKVYKSIEKESYQTDEAKELIQEDKLYALLTEVRKNARKLERKEASKQRNHEVISTLKLSQIGQLALNNSTKYDDLYQSGGFKTVPKVLNCYCCNKPFQLIHHFYHRLCPDCASFNYQQRFESEDLTDRNVVITGARVKVGYATCLKLLRCGANVIATTRFPAIAMEQFMQETDFSEWQDRLWVYGLDLRNINALDSFVTFVKTQFEWCDILINNAAQTIKYPENYYAPLIQNEQLALSHFPSSSAKLVNNQTPVCEQVKLLALEGSKVNFEMNRFGQPIDYRNKNSWNSTLDEISNFELLEVNLINHISPYLLIRDLKPCFLKSPFTKRFIINVTSSEGQFSYQNKTIFHPHTNMTKAALNMMTRTTASDFVRDGIYMNSVDVGWISTGAHEQLRKKQFDNGMMPPLDPVDGAARIMYPIFLGIQGQLFVGKLLKNYREVDW